MSDYIRPPIVTEYEDVRAQMFADLKARIPGWKENPLALDTADLEVTALQIATLHEIASSVMDSIARWIFSQFSIDPLDATFATADSTWTMVDGKGYEIPAGTEVRKLVTGDQAVGFRVVETVVVVPGQTTTAAGEVKLEALLTGAAGSGLTGSLEAVTPLDGVASIQLVGTTQGGRDAEDDPAYLNRATRRLRRLTFGLARPDDVAEAVMEVAGVDRVLVLDNYIPGVNEKQTISHAGTGGTLPVTWNGQTTAQIAWNADAATFKAALEALSNINPGDIIVTGAALHTGLTVEFVGPKGRADQPQMTADNASLTPGSSAITITTVQAGVAAQTNAKGAMTAAPIDAAGQDVGQTIKDTVVAELQAGSEQGFLYSVMGATRTDVTIAFGFTTYPGFDPAAVKAAGEAAGTTYLSGANWGRPTFGDARSVPGAWVEDTVVRFGEVYAVLNGVQGLDHVTSLTINGLANQDVPLAGPAALPRVLSVTGTPA